MGRTVLIAPARSIVGARRSRGIAAGLAAAMLLFAAHVLFECGDIDEAHRRHAWRQDGQEVRAW